MTDRRFPAPWSIENIGAAFVVKDSSGQKLGYFYCEEAPGPAVRPAALGGRFAQQFTTLHPRCRPPDLF